MSEPWWARHGLALALVAYAGAGIAHTFLTPPYEPPDEGGHVICAREMTLARLGNQMAFGTYYTRANTGHHPPVYYFLAHPLAAAIGTQPEGMVRNPEYPRSPRFLLMPPGTHPENMAGLWALRLLGVAAGAIVIVAAWGATKRLAGSFAGRWAGQESAAAAIAAWLVATLPGFSHRAAAAGNDPPSQALAAVFILAALGGRDFPELPWRRAVWLGAVAGIGMIVKSTLLFLTAVLVIWAIALGYKNRNFRVAVPGMGAVVIALALGGWWYIRNAYLYGDFTARNFMLTLAPDAARTEPVSFSYYGKVLYYQAVLFVMQIGSAVPGPWWLYVMYGALAVLAAIGLRRAAGVAAKRDGPAWADWRKLLVTQPVAVFMVVMTGMPVALHLWHQLTSFSPSGRLIYVSLPGIAAAAGLGLVAWRGPLPGIMISGVCGAVGAIVGIAWNAWKLAYGG